MFKTDHHNVSSPARSACRENLLENQENNSMLLLGAISPIRNGKENGTLLLYEHQSSNIAKEHPYLVHLLLEEVALALKKAQNLLVLDKKEHQVSFMYQLILAISSSTRLVKYTRKTMTAIVVDDPTDRVPDLCKRLT